MNNTQELVKKHNNFMKEKWINIQLNYLYWNKNECFPDGSCIVENVIYICTSLAEVNVKKSSARSIRKRI